MMSSPNDPTLPSSDEARVNEIRARFEDALEKWSNKTGERPRIEDYLDSGQSELQRRALFRSLLRTELEHLGEIGEGPSPEAFKKRFPDCQQQIDDIFEAAKRASQPTGTRPDNPAGADRFVIRRRIGSGAMGVVHEAYDRQRREVVALKTIRDVDPTAIYRLKREFRALADLVHPNLVRIHELFFRDHNWFFSMEFVKGISFLEYVRFGAAAWLPEERSPKAADGLSTFDQMGDGTGGISGKDKPSGGVDETARSDGRGLAGVGGRAPCNGLGWEQINRLRASIGGLARGISAIHQAGRLHRDVKPSNVLVTPQGRAVLLDAGLATDIARSADGETTGVNIVGTAAYMSPEQAAAQRLSPATDWYSFGVVLYEALTGRRPFEGSALDVLKDKQEKAPAAPHDLVRHVPDDLNSLCADLLCRDPSARPLGDEVLKRLGAESQEQPTDTFAPPKPVDQGALVGRQQHLRSLDAALRETERGEPVVALVRGESGMGKTALVQHFLARVRRQQRAVVLAGRCFERESVPFKAVDNLVDALSHYLLSLPRPQTEALLPRHVDALAHVFPVLNRVDAVAEAPGQRVEISDQQRLRQLAFGALRGLLARIADRCPLVLHIDDLQWGDLDSVVLLSDLLRPPDAPVVLLVGCYRSEEQAGSPFLRAFLDPRSEINQYTTPRYIDVGELGRPDAEELASLLLGSAGEGATELVGAIASESRGHPFFVEALAQHYQENVTALNECPRETEEVKLDDVLRRRARRLPEPTLRLLRVVAAAGHPIRNGEAFEAADVADVAHEAINSLRLAHLVRTSGDDLDDSVETYHDRIRESVIADTTPEELAALHAKLATVLERSPSVDAASVADHFALAARPEKAADWFAVAAREAAESLAFERAAEMYGRVLQLKSPPAAEEASLRRLQGDAFANAGRGAEAAQAYVAAAEHATEEDEEIDLLGLAAHYLFSTQVEEGVRLTHQLLARMGLKLPESRSRLLIHLLAGRFRLRIRGLRFKRREVEDVSPGELRCIDTFWSLTTGLALVDPLQSRILQTHGFLRALRCGEVFRIARAMSMDAGHASAAGGRAKKRVDDLLSQSRHLSRVCGTSSLDGLLSLADGIAACMQGRWAQAVEACDRVEEILLDPSSDREWGIEKWGTIDVAQSMATTALFWSGQIAELALRMPKYLRLARRRGNHFALVNLTTLNPAPLAADEPDRAREELLDVMSRWTDESYQVQHFYAFFNRLQTELYCGRVSEAERIVTQHWNNIRRSGLMRVQLLRAFSYYARARCALAEAEQAARPASLLRRAERDAKRIKRERQAWTRPLADLILAGAARVRGTTDGAVQLLQQAVARFDAVDMPLHAAAARNRLGTLLGGDEGAKLSAMADSWMTGQGIRNPARFTAMLAPGFPD